ncbi:MAG: DNA-3-methyladenine glycosylase family protein [Burkholderiales bacterium]|jgi:DNA-3-methyladenine glycosylase II|nr:DNA-3-methyladenine glycosylase 2 family protein [Nitrosomonadaceae bacterium]
MTPEYWSDACKRLSKRCKVMRGLIREYPEATLRTRGNAFSTLARAIVGQQISVKAAQSVWDRTVLTVGTVEPMSFLDLDDETLRACGLSRSKVVYLKDLATHFHEKRLNPRRWPRMTDDAIIEDLVRVKGIGRWSAEMFLIFYLMRPNVFPVDDIGLIRAIERHFHDGDRLSKAEVLAYAERWAPWNTVATWYLWRSLDPIPVEY